MWGLDFGGEDVELGESMDIMEGDVIEEEGEWRFGDIIGWDLGDVCDWDIGCCIL